MVTRWQFYDPVTTETYVLPRNPRAMQGITVERNITASVTTAVDGQSLVTEGNAEPRSWSFTGRVYTSTEYDAMLAWSQKGYRIQVTDHFGRTFYVLLTHFDPEPINRSKNYWAHEYAMRAIILTVPTAGTVGLT